MNRAGLLLTLLTVSVLTGCALLPEWRVFQKKIDPKLAEKPAAQIEAERAAAAYIVTRSQVSGRSPQVSDLSSQLSEIHSVAVPLAASLGAPNKPVTAADHARVIEQLTAGLRAEQKKAEQWRAFALKYAGKPIEDTGINLAGPAGLLGLAAVVALCIAVPPVGYVILRALPILWGFFRSSTSAIKEFADAHPRAGEDLAVTLSRKMDTAHKALVRKKAPRINRLSPSPT